MRTIIAGLTGGIGSGKSTAEELCRSWGIPVADADTWAHEILRSDREVEEAVEKYFRDRYGVSVRTATGELDRRLIAAKVFEDEGALTMLEGLIHPRVKARAETWIAAQRAAQVAVAVLIVPLLFESGMERQVDCVITLAVPAEERVRRLRAARGWSEEEIRARMRRQFGEAEREARADYIVPNTGTREEFAAALRQVLEQLCARANRVA
ncbi:MAG: dephospho-CoA kinase [bacterium]|nr:dephospho-CoA kinase [bacterium]